MIFFFSGAKFQSLFSRKSRCYRTALPRPLDPPHFCSHFWSITRFDCGLYYCYNHKLIDYYYPHPGRLKASFSLHAQNQIHASFRWPDLVLMTFLSTQPRLWLAEPSVAWEMEGLTFERQWPLVLGDWSASFSLLAFLYVYFEALRDTAIVWALKKTWRGWSGISYSLWQILSEQHSSPPPPPCSKVPRMENVQGSLCWNFTAICRRFPSFKRGAFR